MKIANFFFAREVKESDALYQLAKDTKAREKKKILKEAVELADQEQRKTYYGRP